MNSFKMEIREKQNGFSILHNGEPLIEHSPKRPLFLFSKDQRARGIGLRWMNLPARDWKILPSDEGSIIVDFPGFLKINMRQQDFALRLTLESVNPRLKSIRIRLPRLKKETICGQADGFPGSGLQRGQNLNAALSRRLPGRFAGSKGFFLSVESAVPLRIDPGRRGSFLLDLSGIPASFALGRAGSHAEARTGLNRLVTIKSRIPRWSAEGIWLSLRGGETLVAKNLSAVLDAGVAVSAIILKDWAGGGMSRRFAWSWNTDAKAYATLEDDIARYRQAGIRVLGYASPYLDEGSPDFSKAREKGWLVGSSIASVHLMNTACGRAGFVDLWNPQAYEALKSAISKNLVGLGMSGWFADHGFFIPPKNTLTHEKQAIQACREYAYLWSALNAEVLSESGRASDLVCIMRPGNGGRATNESTMHVQCAQSRKAVWGSGGLTGEIDARIAEPGVFYGETGGTLPHDAHARSTGGDARELFMRWAESSAFSPLFCNSDASPVQPWTDPAVLAHFCRMASIHALLREYHHDTLESFYAGGRPPVSHPSVHYGTRSGETPFSRHFMYGKDLLIMPITAPGISFVQGTLPDDTWIHLWTTGQFGGGPVTVEALLGYPAVFFRADSPWAGLFDKVRLEAKRAE